MTEGDVTYPATIGPGRLGLVQCQNLPVLRLQVRLRHRVSRDLPDRTQVDDPSLRWGRHLCHCEVSREITLVTDVHYGSGALSPEITMGMFH